MALTITSGVSILRLLDTLNRTQAERAITMARLSTQKRLNKASDDPAGLIAVNKLHSELEAVNAALDNNQRTQSMMDTASGALAEVSSLVNDIQGLAVASGGNMLSAEELAANQSQIDSAIDSIDRIINSTSFNGSKLFTGGNLISTSMSVADAAAVKDVHVYSRANITGSTALSVSVTTTAKHGTTSGTVVANISSPLSTATVLAISGKAGTAAVTLASGSNIASVVTQINASKGETGVSATSSGTQLKLTSVDFGKDAFVSVSAISGVPSVVATAQVSKKSGSDAVVTVNGAKAAVSGTEFYYSGNSVSFSANLATNATGTYSITVTGGGAAFQVGTSASSKAVLGLGALTSSSLGRSDLGYLSSLKSGGAASLINDPAAAALIADKAGLQVSTQAARLGAFSKYQLTTSTNALTVMKESLSAAAGAIEDADMALETSRLQRQNLLVSSAMSLLDIMYAQQKSVLDLLN